MKEMVGSRQQVILNTDVTIEKCAFCQKLPVLLLCCLKSFHIRCCNREVSEKHAVSAICEWNIRMRFIRGD